jgi:hypothetical protein
MFSDAAGTIPALTMNAAGFAFTIDVNLNGTTTVTNYSGQTTVVPTTSTIPEPSTLALLGIAVIVLGIMRRRATQYHDRPQSRAPEEIRSTDHADPRLLVASGSGAVEV